MKEKFEVTGMTCSAWSCRVEKCVSKLEGVEEVSVNLLTVLPQKYLQFHPENQNECDDTAQVFRSAPDRFYFHGEAGECDRWTDIQ